VEKVHPAAYAQTVPWLDVYYRLACPSEMTASSVIDPAS